MGACVEGGTVYNAVIMGLLGDHRIYFGDLDLEACGRYRVSITGFF